MSTVKYQIFLSSTFVDLQDERNEVIKAILEMGHIPVGMEMFSAADEEQWKLIARQIDQSDYYVVIVAHRYGSVAGRVSYTEKEYDYAVEQGIPVIGFVIDDSAPWPKDRIDSDQKKVKLLEKFKNKVKCKPVNFWSSKDDLHSKVAISLMKAFITNLRPGWIRALNVVGPEVVNEMSRLSSENAQYRKQLEELRHYDTSFFSQGKDVVEIDIYRTDHKTDEPQKITTSFTWDELFLVTAGAILSNPSEIFINIEINQFVLNHFKQLLSPDVSDDSVGFNILDESLANIKNQLIALGLILVDTVRITPANRLQTIIEWKLTPLGLRKFAELTAIRRM